MQKLLTKISLSLIMAFGVTIGAHAQTDKSSSGETDDSSDQTQETEEAYRRRMELEGARDQETLANTSYTSQADQEEIDKLPEESQKNIRSQITDIIIENGQWEPSDVLEEYPYEPTEAAKQDSELRKQEEEAWAEQVDKYHEREAAAFGATRPPMPGNEQQSADAGTSGAGGQESESSGGQDGPGQDGGESGKSDASSAGAYEPGKRSDDDEISTAGVSESALDFLRGKGGRAESGSGSGTQQQGQAPSIAQGGNQAQGAQQPQSPESVDSAKQGTEQTPSLADSGSESQAAPDESASEQQESQELTPEGSLPIDQLDLLQGIADAQAAAEQSDPGQPQAPQPAEQNQATQTEPDEAQTEAEQLSQTSEEAQQSQQESENEEQQSSLDLDLSTPGIIAIQDLNKLEGVEDQEGDESN